MLFCFEKFFTMKYSLIAVACIFGLVFANEDDDDREDPTSPTSPGSANGAPLIPAGSEWALLIEVPGYSCPVTATAAAEITAAIKLYGLNPTSIQIGCGTLTPSSPTSKKLAQTTGLIVGVAGTLTQLSNLQQAIQQGLLASVGIPSTAQLTWLNNGVPAPTPPNVPLNILYNDTIVFGPCVEGFCPSTGCTSGTPITNPSNVNVPSYFNLYCGCNSCSTTTFPAVNLAPSVIVPAVPSFPLLAPSGTRKLSQVPVTGGVRFFFWTNDCTGLPTSTQVKQCSDAVAQAFACYAFRTNYFPSALQSSIANGNWHYTYPSSAGQTTNVNTLTPTVCSLSSSSSKKGLLGLLGLLGLIPLILCCCLLLLCCLRKRKAGPDVHFATFDAGAPAMLPSTGVPPVGACYPSVVGVSPHAPSIVV